MATTHFSVPQVTVPVITKLSILDEKNVEQWVRDYPDLVMGNYFMSITGLPGVMKYTSREWFDTWRDKNRPFALATVLDAASGAAGAAVEVQLTVDSHTGLDGSLSPVAVGQIWENNSTAVKYEIRAVNKSVDNAHTVLLAPAKSSQAVDLEAGESLKWQGYTSVEEASTKNPGMYRGFEQARQYVNIIRTDQEYSDLALFTKTDIDGQTYYALMSPDLDKNHIGSREMQHVFGEDMDNLQAPSNRAGRAKGLVQKAKEANGTLNPAGGILDDAFLRLLARQMQSNGYSNEYHMLAGPTFSYDFQEAIADIFGTNGAIIYGSFDGQREIAVSRQFSSYSFLGMTIHTPTIYDWFDATKTHGVPLGTGYYDDAALFLPQGTVSLPDGTTQRFLQIRYMGENEGAPYVRRLQAGGMFSPTSSTSAHGEVALLSYEGLEALQMKSFLFAKLS